MRSDAQNRLAVLVAAICSFLGYAIAGRSGALSWAAMIGLLVYVGGWFTSQYLRAVVEDSLTDPLKMLRKIRAAVLIITGLGSIACLVVLLPRATPETAIASAVFLSGAFAAGQSFSLFERSDLSGSLLITAPRSHCRCRCSLATARCDRHCHRLAGVSGRIPDSVPHI